MTRNPHYQEFLDANKNGFVDPTSPTLVTEATPQEIGWRQRLEVTRAVNAMRYSVATPEQLALLVSKHKIIPIGAIIRTRRMVDRFNN